VIIKKNNKKSYNKTTEKVSMKNYLTSAMKADQSYECRSGTKPCLQLETFSKFGGIKATILIKV